MEAIIVAVVGVVGAVIITRIEKGRKEDSSEHDMLMKAVQKVEQKVDKHIEWHMEQTPKPRTRKK
jgi:hypothetical protein